MIRDIEGYGGSGRAIRGAARPGDDPGTIRDDPGRSRTIPGEAGHVGRSIERQVDFPGTIWYDGQDLEGTGPSRTPCRPALFSLSSLSFSLSVYDRYI